MVSSFVYFIIFYFLPFPLISFPFSLFLLFSFHFFSHFSPSLLYFISSCSSSCSSSSSFISLGSSIYLNIIACANHVIVFRKRTLIKWLNGFIIFLCIFLCFFFLCYCILLNKHCCSINTCFTILKSWWRFIKGFSIIYIYIYVYIYVCMYVFIYTNHTYHIYIYIYIYIYTNHIYHIYIYIYINSQEGIKVSGNSGQVYY